MQCETCQGKEATVHITEIVDNKKKVMHLCEECARQHSGIVSSMIKQVFQTLTPAPAKGSEKTCPDCGISLTEIMKTGKFGCPKDYVVFKKQIEPMISRLHNSTQHTGKVPATIAKKDSKKRIKDLEKLIGKAVEGEKYEEAAKYRDEIKKLQD